MGRLANKVAVVTGASRGIGASIARTLAAEGAAVVVNYASSKDGADQVVAAIAADGGTAVAIQGNVSKASDVRHLFDETKRRFGRLDVLVNNAGILQGALLGMITDGLIRAVLDTNVIGSLVHLQEASRLMARNQRGSIINVSSIIGRFGTEGQTAYAASKAAVIGMTKAAAKELAPKNIRVNAVAPGYIDTDMTRQMPQNKLQRQIPEIRMGRIGTVDEVAQAIMFLASDMSSYVTGQVLGVDGGMII